MRLGIDIDDVLFPWFDKAHAACERAGITNGVNGADGLRSLPDVLRSAIAYIGERMSIVRGV